MAFLGSRLGSFFSLSLNPSPKGRGKTSEARQGEGFTSFLVGLRLLAMTVLGFLFVSPVHAATGIPFTINLDDTVIVTGSPRIQMDVGGTTRYATYTSGTGTNALTFTYAMLSGDVDADGVTLISPIQLNGGTIKDTKGNDATLTFPVPNTSNVKVNAAVPSGYSVAFADETVTNANKTALAFSLTYPKANKTLHYSITSSNGGTPITGMLPTLAGTTTVTGINATTLPDGLLILSTYLTDSIGGTGATVTDTIPMAALDASLVGHWTFDANDISGTTAYDRSGNTNNGTLTNGPTQTTGQVGGALNFDGVNQLVTYSNSPSVQISDGTIISWIKTNNAGGAYRGILTKSLAYGMYLQGNIFGAYDPGTGAFRTSGISLADNNWHQVVLVFSSGNVGASSLYIDGLVVVPSTTVTNTSQASGPVTARGQGGLPQAMQGMIDDVRIYNRALTPTEITTLYNATH